MTGRRALLLVDHGSRRPDANALVLEVALALAASGERTAHAHLELAAPSVPEVLDALYGEGFREIVVHPFFLAPGRHAAEDVPRLCREAEARLPGLRIRITAPLGRAEDLATLVRSRVAELDP